MTRNQIAYAEHLRNIRNDAETKRSNQANEDINRERNKETNRHNLETERFNYVSLDEQSRHNRATESIGYGNISVGMAQVGAQYAQIAENRRHNQQNEYLTGVQLNNQASRDIDTYNINLYNAQVRDEELQESIRHNKMNESLSYYNSLKDYSLGMENLSASYLKILTDPFKFILNGNTSGGTNNEPSIKIFKTK